MVIKYFCEGKQNPIGKKIDYFPMEMNFGFDFVRVLILITVLILFNTILSSCAINPPPLEFAPNANIIESAIALQLEKNYQHLSKHLESQKPLLKIEKINVRNIQPTSKFNLPTYHLTGDYQLIIKNKQGKKQKIKNTFSLDLQRQNAGKTWRLLLPDNNSNSGKYLSYLIQE